MLCTEADFVCVQHGHSVLFPTLSLFHLISTSPEKYSRIEPGSTTYKTHEQALTVWQKVLIWA